MQTRRIIKLTISLFLCAGVQTAPAQTNVTFQNCQAGDLVRVKCDHPLLVLGKATLLEIGSNTVTVATASDRFTLNQTNVTLVALGSHAAPQAEISPANSALSQITDSAATAPGAAPMLDLSQTLESLRTSLIDSHRMEAYKEPKLVNGKWELVIDPNSTNGKAKYDKANAYYHQTMSGVQNGSVSQADLVNQAKEILALCDKYSAERKNDPQYEKQIEILRDFVRRSEAGEKIDFGKPVQ